MLRLVVLCTFLCVVTAKSVVPYLETEQFREWSGRIVGGQTAEPGAHPYQVSLRTPTNFHFCGASILSSTWVLTAAHCTDGRTPDNTFVVFGAHSLTDGTTHTVSRIENHPQWTTFLTQNDVAVVATEQPIVFTAFVQAIPLKTSFTGAGEDAVASGWGQTSHPGSAASHLQVLHVVTLSLNDCRSRHNFVNSLSVHDNTICTFGAIGNGLCMGDSGGPLTVNGQLVGAVSWGVPCAQGAPDVFARLADHSEFILSFVSL